MLRHKHVHAETVSVITFSCDDCNNLQGSAAGNGLELPPVALPSASLKMDQPLLHMTASAVAADAAPVVVGMTADRMLRRYELPKELGGWGAVKGRQLSPQSMTHGPQKVIYDPMIWVHAPAPSFVIGL